MIFGALALVASGAAAWAAEPPKDGGLDLPLEARLTSPSWLKQPTPEDLTREYPQLATMMGINGGATITCDAETDGRVDNCHVVSEWPAGLGFGAAAVRSSAYFVMSPATRDGVAVASKVTIPLKFQLEGSQAAASVADLPLPHVSPESVALARQIFELKGSAAMLKVTWSKYVEQQAAVIIANGGGQNGQAALDAYRQALNDAASQYLETKAHILASKMSLGELKATAAFLQSPAGKSWLSADKAVMMDEHPNLHTLIARAAAKHLCAQIACGDQPFAAAKPTGQ